MSQTTYQIDPAHSAAHFSVRHMMIANVRGEFTKVAGKFIYDPQNLADSSIEATIDVASIHTNDPDRDQHLKSPDFLDADKYPQMTFQSKSITSDDGELVIRGDLTLHGVTQEVTLHADTPSPEVKDPWGNIRIGATATGKIARKDFGLGWNVVLEAGGVLVGEEVKLSLEVQGIKQA
jgi:polyisoprenoid-binding protein YceI